MCSSGTYGRGELITHETWITLAEHCKERPQCHFVWCGIKNYRDFISRSLKRVSFSDSEVKQKAEQYLLKVSRFVIHFDPELFKIFHGIDWKCLVWNTTKGSQYSKTSICHFVLTSTLSLDSLKTPFCVWPIKICPEHFVYEKNTEYTHEYAIRSFKDIWTY